MTMSRKRWMIVGLIVLAAVAIEVGVRLARRPGAGLMVINAGTAPIRGLVASYSGVQILVGDVAPGATKLIRLQNGPKEVVTLAFEQAGNPSPGVVIGGEELDQARREGLRVVLTFQPGQVVRFMEEDDQRDKDSPLARIWSWIYDVLFVTPATPGGVARRWPW